jgi:hypothetical protein
MNAEWTSDLERVAVKFAVLIRAGVKRDGFAAAFSDFMGEQHAIAWPLFEQARAVATKHNVDAFENGVAFAVMVSQLAREEARPKGSPLNS